MPARRPRCPYPHPPSPAPSLALVSPPCPCRLSLCSNPPEPILEELRAQEDRHDEGRRPVLVQHALGGGGLAGRHVLDGEACGVVARVDDELKVELPRDGQGVEPLLLPEPRALRHAGAVCVNLEVKVKELLVVGSPCVLLFLHLGGVEHPLGRRLEVDSDPKLLLPGHAPHLVVRMSVLIIQPHQPQLPLSPHLIMPDRHPAARPLGRRLRPRLHGPVPIKEICEINRRFRSHRLS
mmetsp:Transcript_43859/g.109848  ORF Transcript_43859/g.109848 Transcript_43859/m.109848 type:complete len:237 (-) Transcript_43859:86-796(-)